MKKIYCFFLLFCLGAHASFAQKIRTDVCVYGNTTAALAAGIQSARSGVQTLLISNSDSWIDQPSLADWENASIASGLGTELLKKYKQLEKNKVLKADSLLQSIKTLADTVKNLKIISASTIEEIKESYIKGSLPSSIVRLFFDSWSDFRTSLKKVIHYHKNQPSTLIIPTHCAETTDPLIRSRIDLDVL